jgi:hypothetical protein
MRAVTNAIAIASVVSSAAVAIATLGFNWWNSAQSRDHDAKMARASRNFDARRQVYSDILEYFHRLQLFMARTEPIWEPAPEPPDLPHEDEGLRLGAQTAAFASDEVNQAVDECQAAYREWWFGGVWIYRRLKEQLGQHEGRTIEARAAMHKQQDKYGERVRKLERLIRQDLQG